MTHVGGYHEYRGRCSVPWEKNVLLFEYSHGGCSVPWGKNLLLFEYPHGTEHPPRYS